MTKSQRSQESGTFFRSEKFHFSVPLQSMQSAATFLPRHPHRSAQQWTEKKVETLCMAYRGTKKLNSENLKNVPEFLDLQDSGTFFLFEKFHLHL